jgi:hypothetical protein
MLEKSNILVILLVISVSLNIYLYFVDNFSLLPINTASSVTNELYLLFIRLNRKNLDDKKDFPIYLNILQKNKILKESMYSYSTFIYFVTLNETRKLTRQVIEKELSS